MGFPRGAKVMPRSADFPPYSVTLIIVIAAAGRTADSMSALCRIRGDLTPWVTFGNVGRVRVPGCASLHQHRRYLDRLSGLGSTVVLADSGWACVSGPARAVWREWALEQQRQGGHCNQYPNAGHIDEHDLVRPPYRRQRLRVHVNVLCLMLCHIATSILLQVRTPVSVTPGAVTSPAGGTVYLSIP